MMNQISLTIKNTKLQLPNFQIVRSKLYRLDIKNTFLHTDKTDLIDKHRLF